MENAYFPSPASYDDVTGMNLDRATSVFIGTHYLHTSGSCRILYVSDEDSYVILSRGSWSVSMLRDKDVMAYVDRTMTLTLEPVDILRVHDPRETKRKREIE